MSKGSVDSQPPESHSQRLSDRHNVDLWLSKKSSELRVLGAILQVRPDAYNTKRDYITCTRVPPHERHKHLPDLSTNETICGEIYTVTANKKVLKNGITLWLPFTPPSNPDLQELRLKVKYKDEPSASWLYCDYVVAEKGDNRTPFIEVSVARGATYAPTILPKREVFAVTDQGLLYNARISRYLAVRFPRKCIDRPELEYYIEVHPLGVEKEREMRRDYPEEMAPFESISDFVDIVGPQMQFKRPLGLKLGIPAAARDVELDYLDSAVIVLRKSAASDESWWVVEDSIKVTRTTVSFTTKELGRFVVAVVDPSKKLWLRKYMPFIEHMNATTRCEVLVFTKFEKKVWSLWVETVPASVAAAVADSRELAGMRCVSRPRRAAMSASDQESVTQAGSGAPHDAYLDGRLSARRQRSANRGAALSLRDSAVCYWIEIHGDLRPADYDEEEEEKAGGGPRTLHEQLCCFALEENYRVFDVEPVAPTALATACVEADGRGCVRLYVERRSMAGAGTAAAAAGAPATVAAAGRECVRTWDFDIPRQDIEEYFYVEQEMSQKEATVAKMEVDEFSAEDAAQPERRQSSAVTASITSTVAIVVEPARSPRRHSRIERMERVRQREITVVNLMRLTESKRAKVKVDREPKVLSGRSLMTLSRRVEEGLTLAVYLDIPDSTITGLGFDALANGLSLQEVTYKILLLWKRRSAIGGQAKVEQLAGALKAMGRADVVAQLWEHHLKNAELTPESFMSGGDDAGADDDVVAEDDAGIAEDESAAA